MFLRFVAESIRRSPRRKAMTVAAVAMGAAVATAMLGVMLDIGDKINLELRSMGANIMVTPKARSMPVQVAGIQATPVGEEAFIPEAQIPRIKSIFWQLNITGFAPSLSAESDGITVRGVWFDHNYRTPDGREQHTGIRALNPAWKLNGTWIDDARTLPERAECVIGSSLAARLRLRPGSTVSLFRTPFTVAGVLTTGGEEDNQVLAPLSTVQRLLNRPGQVDSLQVAALTKPEDDFARKDPATMSPKDLERWNCTNYVSSIAKQIQDVLPMAVAKPVWRVADNEGRVLSRISGLMLLVAIAALLASGLTVWSAMATTVLERRSEIAIMQAAGASDWLISGLFSLEIALQGLVGGIVGVLAGLQMARWVGSSVFRTAIETPVILAPLVVFIAVMVAVSGALPPLRRSLRIPPAVILRESV